MSWRVEAGLCTSSGPGKGRNEDCAAIGGLLLAADTPSALGVTLPLGLPTVALIADGMGGHSSGEIASRLVAESLVADQGLSGGHTTAIEAALRATNRMLLEASLADQRRRGMGSTVVGVVVPPEGNGVAFNVGDSRLMIRDRDLGVYQCSVDDAARSGTGTTPELTQCLGGTTDLTEISPHVREFALAEDDRLILCSDGLSDVLSTEDIAGEIAENRSATAAAWALVALAKAKGAQDDVTVVVLDINEER